MMTRYPIIARWLAILRARPDTEHEMTLNRMAFAVVVIVYLAVATAVGLSHASEIFYRVYPVFIAYIMGSMALFAYILYRPAAMPARRIIAAIYDMAMISYAAQACGTSAGLFYPLYLWTIFGNGFRFGVFYLGVSMVIATIGFTIVLRITGFWSSNPGFSIALLIGLVMLPIYVSRLIRKLSEAKRQAEVASKAKSQFLTSVTHELRTPLNAIIGLSSLFKGVELDREHAEMMETIGAAGRTLLGHINSILDLSRVEAGKVLSQKSEFDLYDLLLQVKNIVAVRERDLRLSVHITSRTPQFIVGARQQLEQILLNLAGNAVKFTSSGFVVIAVDAISQSHGLTRLRFEVSDTGIGISPSAKKRIFESFSQADDTIIDRFGGTGLGLALCKQLVEIQGGEIGVDSYPNIGSTFWFEIDFASKLEQPATQIFDGEAILACADDQLKSLVRSVVPNVRFAENLAQSIDALKELESLAENQPVVIFDFSPGEGIADAVLDSNEKVVPVLIRGVDSSRKGFLPNPERSFYVTTLKDGADLAELNSVLQIAVTIGGRKAIAEEIGAVARHDKSLSILVADDNRTNLLVVSKVLEQAGHTVTTVENGAAAVEALECEQFDVAIMDLNMPVLNGFDAFKKYRNSLGDRGLIPVIALTADATDATNARCIDAGFQACATKPIEPRHLLEVVAEVTAHPSNEVTSPALIPSMHQVTSSQPRLSGNIKVKRETLHKLEQLGGRSFVEEVINQFIKDGHNMMNGLRLAFEERDATKFDDELHAMRSSAGNIGAEALYRTCLALKQISAEELEAKGEKLLEQLAAEVDSARKELADYLGETVAAKESASAVLSKTQTCH